MVAPLWGRVGGRLLALVIGLVAALGPEVVLAEVVPALVLERELGPVAVLALSVGRELDLAVVLALAVERELDLAVVLALAVEREFGPVAGQELARVAEQIASVAAVHPRAAAVALSVAVELAETPPGPPVAEGVIAWAVVVLVAVVEEAAPVAAGAGDKRTGDEEKINEIKNKYYDFVEDFSGCFCGRYLLFVKPRRAGGANSQVGCGCDVAAKGKAVRHTEAGS